MIWTRVSRMRPQTSAAACASMPIYASLFHLPSTAPVVGNGPVVSIIVDGNNIVTLGSFDPEDDDLTTRILSAPASGTLIDAEGNILTGGSTVHDAARKQNKRVWYTPTAFDSWTGDVFTYDVSDGGSPVRADVMLERYSIPAPSNRSMMVLEDALGYQMVGAPYITSKNKTTANLRVRITELPARGTLYQACFAEGSDNTYTSLCSAGSGTPENITAVGTMLTNSRGESLL
jgi:hypothetical protein